MPLSMPSATATEHGNHTTTIVQTSGENEHTMCSKRIHRHSIARLSIATIIFRHSRKLSLFFSSAIRQKSGKGQGALSSLKLTSLLVEMLGTEFTVGAIDCVRAEDIKRNEVILFSPCLHIIAVSTIMDYET